MAGQPSRVDFACASDGRPSASAWSRLTAGAAAGRTIRHEVTSASEAAVLRQPHEINLRLDNVITAIEAALLDRAARVGQAFDGRLGIDDTRVGVDDGGVYTVNDLLHGLLTPGAAPRHGKATELHRLLQTGLATLRRRSTVFVVSDFISEPGWEKPLGELARRHDVVAVRLLDPLELELPDVGLVTLRDAESGEQLQVDTHDAGFRRRFAQLAADREAALREGLTRAGADTLELCTDDDLVDALLRFMDLRQRRVRAHSNPLVSVSASASAAPAAQAAAA